MCRLFVLLFFLIIMTHVEGTAKLLKKEDVHKTMDELFTYHVEYKELAPLLIKRSFKIYIENFDPARIYLLNNEVKPFLEFSQTDLLKIIDRYQHNDFSDYERLNQVISQSIKRARAFRLEIKEKLITGGLDNDPSYAKGSDSLRERIAKQYNYFLIQEGAGIALSDENREKFFALWDKRLSRLEDNYLAKAQQGEHFLILHMLKALAKSLDAHTAYYSPDEALELRTALEKQSEGIGVILREGIDGIRVVGLIKGGPAEKSGKVQEGDLIEFINGKSMREISYEDFLERLRGARGQEVQLGLKRLDSAGIEETLEVRIKRDKIVMEGERVNYSAVPFADGIIGKIDLPSFYESADGSSCEQDLRSAIKQLQHQGKLLGLIIDMRENSGGFLTQAVKVGGLFITNGVIVISKYAEGEVQYLRAVDGRVSYTGILVILTSKGSASAAEIVAQALQDYGTAIIVGDERTYGKGSIQYQTVTDDHPKAYFKVTVGKYYTVSGKSTQIEGVKADIHLPSAYSALNIGEKFLDYPLPRDQMPPAFVDPLSDLEGQKKQWFQKNYLPCLQQKDYSWRKVLPILQRDSAYRLEHDHDFALYAKYLKERGGIPPSEGVWGVEDLQMREALRIIQDMVLLKP